MHLVEAKIVDIDAANRRATVGVRRAPACARCLAGRGCGAGLLAADGLVHLEIELPDGSAQIEPGQTIALELAPSRLIEASMLAYGVPLAGAVVAALSAAAAGLGEPATIVAALLGLAAGFAVSRSRLRRSGCLQRFRPRLADPAA